jgi:hypothetical protein
MLVLVLVLVLGHIEQFREIYEQKAPKFIKAQK